MLKYLQIHENAKEIEPKLLEIGVDFMQIHTARDFVNLTIITGFDHKVICYVKDTYQSRPLIEIDGFCEFDVVLIKKTGYYTENLVRLICLRRMGFNLIPETGDLRYCTPYALYEIDFDNKEIVKPNTENFGSIFSPENKSKYPKLYEEALKIINQSK
jgi:hypothetical protein